MPATLRRGDTGPDVDLLQNTLILKGYPLVADGDFGPRTEARVIEFQESEGLYADGIVGPLTWERLDTEQPAKPISVSTQELVRVTVGPYPPGGYKHLRLRADAAGALDAAFASMRRAGAKPSTSGGTRSLTAKVGPNRSATSLHYQGLAVDLWVGAAMSNPAKDPYIVIRNGVSPKRHWRVYAATTTDDAPVGSLIGVRAGRQPKLVERSVIDLTDLMSKHGFERIQSRRRSWEGIAENRKLHGGTEWWHFQYERGLEEGVTFGDCLLAVYPERKLVGTPPWRFRHYTWRGQAFVR